MPRTSPQLMPHKKTLVATHRAKAAIYKGTPPDLIDQTTVAMCLPAVTGAPDSEPTPELLTKWGEPYEKTPQRIMDGQISLRYPGENQCWTITATSREIEEEVETLTYDIHVYDFGDATP